MAPKRGRPSALSKGNVPVPRSPHNKQAAPRTPRSPGVKPTVSHRSPANSPLRGRAALSGLVSPGGRRGNESPNGSRSPLFRSELNLPIDPEIEKEYLKAILLPDRSDKHDTATLPAGYNSWQAVPPCTSAYTNFAEMQALKQEFPDCAPHDLNEPVKPVSAAFAQASGMLQRTVYTGGRYGRVEGMRMGINTMQLYYVVKFSSGLIQHFLNFQVEKFLTDEDSLPALDQESRGRPAGAKGAKASIVKRKGKN